MPKGKQLFSCRKSSRSQREKGRNISYIFHLNRRRNNLTLRITGYGLFGLHFLPWHLLTKILREDWGFERVTIAPNETANVTMMIPYDELKYYDVTENKFVLEDAEYHFLVGPASDKLVTGKMVE